MTQILLKCNFLIWMHFFVPLTVLCQEKQFQDSSKEDVYYIGINPVAPFTSIRSEATSLYLPVLSNLETGIAVFVGKTWNRNYNVETRLSFGSPLRSYNLLQVQSGFNYCFNSMKKKWNPYMGMFIKLYSLHNLDTKTDNVSAILYANIGNRFICNRYFLDLRLNQNIYALSWSSLPGSKAKSGFQSSIYKWRSAYIPYAAINIGYFF